MNWYVITKTAAEMNPENPTQWQRNPDDPRWKTWQKFDRQRQFPFMSNHQQPFQRQYKDPDAEMYGFEKDDTPAQGGTLYHVTTNLAGIKIDGRLKSRSELKDTMGLGGGFKDEARNAVSLTYEYSRALNIYEQLHLVAGVVRGQIPPSQIYSHMASHVDAPMDGFNDFDRVIINHGVPKNYVRDGDEEQIKAILDRTILTPEDRYSFLQSCEESITNQEMADYENSDSVLQQSVIGFTAPFASMKNLNPAQVAIIQCVLRKGADVEHVMQEMEVRASPADLAVVRYMQPNPGY